MNNHSRCRILKTISLGWLTSLAFACLLTSAHAQTLPSGVYRGTAEIGAVLLDGRYPFKLGELPGEIEVTTSPTGLVTGRALVLDQPFPIEGQIKSRRGYIRVALFGDLEGARFSLKATLQNGAFVGTVKLAAAESPCQFDITATGPLRPEYVLSLVVDPNGKISGPGTLFAARQQVALTARGSVSRDGRVQLTIKGPKVFFKTTSGKIDGAGIHVAKWTAQGFGALVKGTNLRFAHDPP